MSCIFEMTSSINLATLPPDIIRRIIRMDGDSATSMRSISHLWNDLAKKYLSGLKLPASLERVYLYVGIPEDYYLGRKMDSTLRNTVQMCAIFPERHASCVGVGGWLEKFRQQHTGGAVEVCSSRCDIMHQIDIIAVRLSPIIILGLTLKILCLFNNIIHPTIPIPIVAILVALTILFAYIGRSILSMQNKEHARFVRFYSTFSHIETLVLENFRSHSFFRLHMLNAVQDTLKCVRINRLEIREDKLTRRLQNRVLEMCRKHEIRHVFITVYDIEHGAFGTFIVGLSKLGVALDIYERNGLDDAKYFRKSIDYWNELAIDLNSKQVSMIMHTIHDASFDKVEYRFGVKSHLRCENVDGNNPQTLKPVDILRGFNYRWN